jgi:hypothetical protein
MSNNPSPCPWCGSRAEVEIANYAWCFVCCTDVYACGAAGPGRDSNLEAVAAWNRMASWAQPTEDIVPAIDELVGLAHSVAVAQAQLAHAFGERATNKYMMMERDERRLVERRDAKRRQVVSAIRALTVAR